VERALSGEYDGWAETPRGRVALVILLDQLTRNLFRGTPRAFAGDLRAERVAKEAVDAGEDGALRPFERVFLRMPLMHAEDRELQRAGVAAFGALVREHPDHGESMRDFLSYAERHCATVERFGRFPHRNAVLARETTAEEAAFLAEHPAGF